jgi:predicted ATPase
LPLAWFTDAALCRWERGEQVEQYYIESLAVDDLWGSRTFQIEFGRNVNILIGPNASGKTTILNLLYYTLTVRPVLLLGIQFGRVRISGRSLDGKHARTVIAEPSPRGVTFRVSRKSYHIEVVPGAPDVPARFRYGALRRQTQELADLLKSLFPSVWLPVSRRLPIPDDQEDERIARGRPRLESVDECLRESLGELARYRLRLDAQLALQYELFQRRVLDIILYSKDIDGLVATPPDPPTQQDREQLENAFRALGQLDTRMRHKIKEHFSMAESAVSMLRSYLAADAVAGERDFTKSLSQIVRALVILPLIGRTKAMVDFARDLEKERDRLFAQLRCYETILNSFFSPKTARVADSGELQITQGQPPAPLDVSLLSSGEKQLLILLTQAVVREEQPVIYVADEPELSLHVSWQAKLLPSLMELGPQAQVIVATHSPDIAGPYKDKVIDLARLV